MLSLIESQLRYFSMEAEFCGEDAVMVRWLAMSDLLP